MILESKPFATKVAKKTNSMAKYQKTLDFRYLSAGLENDSLIDFTQPIVSARGDSQLSLEQLDSRQVKIKKVPQIASATA